MSGLSSVEEVATGVEHILADMIAKDPETLTYVKTLWEHIHMHTVFQIFFDTVVCVSLMLGPEYLLLYTFVSVFLSCCVRCENSFVTIQSSVSKSALKEKEQEKSVQGHKKPGAPQNKNKDIDKFHLYFDFTCNIQRIQSHQVARQTSLSVS